MEPTAKIPMEKVLVCPSVNSYMIHCTGIREVFYLAGREVLFVHKPYTIDKQYTIGVEKTAIFDPYKVLDFARETFKRPILYSREIPISLAQRIEKVANDNIALQEKVNSVNYDTTGAFQYVFGLKLESTEEEEKKDKDAFEKMSETEIAKKFEEFIGPANNKAIEECEILEKAILEEKLAIGKELQELKESKKLDLNFPVQE